MDVYINMVMDTLQSAGSYISTNFNKIPKEILILGLIAGFFCSLPEAQKQGYGRREENKWLLDIRRASSVLSLLATIAGVAYVFYFLGQISLVYLLASILAGYLLYMLLLKLFSLVEFLGTFFKNLVVIFSGPILIFTFWFFHAGELQKTIKQIFDSLPF